MDRRLGPAAIVGAWLLAAGAVHAQVTFQGLGTLPGAVPGSRATAISADGQVVVGDCPSAATCTEAWRWTGGTGLQGLGFLPGQTSSRAVATSADGSVVLGASGDSIFRWTSPGMQDIGGSLPAGVVHNPRDLSSDGLIAVGGFLNFSTLQGAAYRWTSGGGIEILETFTAPGNIVQYAALSANGSRIAGSDGVVDDPDAFVIDAGVKTHLPEFDDLTCGECGTEVGDITDDGSVVVGHSRGIPFLWRAAVGMIDLGLPESSVQGNALDVSANASVVVGVRYDESGPDTAFRWTPPGGMRDLQTDLIAHGADLTGWELREAVAISSNGTRIVGNGINPSGQREAWLAVLPPPAIPALPLPYAGGVALLLATVGIACDRVRHRAPRRRRRMRASVARSGGSPRA